MPISRAFRDRLYPHLDRIAAHYGTPFHIYDEAGIRSTGERLKQAFSGVSGFREYFAVKALPNPRILALMGEMGFGFDCSSVPELVLAGDVGARGEDIMFTSNNTTSAEFDEAMARGGVINLDDISLLAKLTRVPELLCFRYNPGPLREGNDIIGRPEEAKFGVAEHQFADAYRRARDLGARRFGLHTMVVSNQLDHNYCVETSRAMLDWAERLEDELGIRFEFINVGGGLGIPYRAEESPLDIDALGRAVAGLVDAFAARRGYAPKIYTESGRYMTGPHGVLVTRVINRKEIYRTHVGVDACMSSLMRPGMYGAYHHVEIPGRDGEEEVVDVVGPLCENNDKFAIQRPLPRAIEGDLVVIHDTGAHGHSMGFTYNGRLRPKELLLREHGGVELIRRAETLADYLATLSFEPDVLNS